MGKMMRFHARMEPRSTLFPTTTHFELMEEMETVNHPAHYNSGKIEVIDFIEDQQLGFNLGNSLKYLCRAEHKGSEVEDLKKAIWYLTRELQRREGTLVTTTQRNFGHAGGTPMEKDQGAG